MIDNSRPNVFCSVLLTVLGLLMMGIADRAGGNEITDLDCIIEPYTTVELGSAVAGILEVMLVQRGDMVEKNQIMARLKSTVEEVEITLARARAASSSEIKSREFRYGLSQRNYDRIKELSTNNLASNAELDEMQTAAKIAEMEIMLARDSHKLHQLELERAVSVLELRSIRSPIPGVVIELFKSAGEYVEEQPILKIARVDLLNVEIIAPMSMFGKIRVGMRARIMPEYPEDGVYIAHVTIVDSVINASSGTFGIRLELPNPDYRIPAGTRCEIKFLTDTAGH